MTFSSIICHCVWIYAWTFPVNCFVQCFRLKYLNGTRRYFWISEQCLHSDSWGELLLTPRHRETHSWWKIFWECKNMRMIVLQVWIIEHSFSNINKHKGGKEVGIIENSFSCSPLSDSVIWRGGTFWIWSFIQTPKILWFSFMNLCLWTCLNFKVIWVRCLTV